MRADNALRGDALKESLGRAVPPRPLNLDSVKDMAHFATLIKILPLICFVLHEESSSFSN